MPDDVYIGGKQLPNPKGISPQLGTDPVKPPMQAHGWIGDTRNAPLTGLHMDTRNAPLHGLFEKPEFRHQLGKGIVKGHPLLKVSEN